jgi:hypothetical protein
MYNGEDHDESNDGDDMEIGELDLQSLADNMGETRPKLHPRSVYTTIKRCPS